MLSRLEALDKREQKLRRGMGADTSWNPLVVVSSPVAVNPAVVVSPLVTVSEPFGDSV